MRRALRSGPREMLLVAAWALLFAVLLAFRVGLQRSAPPPGASLDWLRLGSLTVLGFLLLGAVLANRVPAVGSVALRVEQAAVFLAITRLLGLGAQPDPGRPERVLMALLGVHAVGAIVVSDELRTGTPSWRAGLWVLASSFGALTVSVLTR